MTVLFASYSGLMGGAERVLLEHAVRLPRPLVIACPQGPLAEGVRAAGLTHEPVRERRLAARPGPILGFARELTGLARRHRPDVLVAWGARAVLAAAVVPRRPRTLAVHHDLLPRPAIRGAVRAATHRAHGAAAASEAIARDLGLPATILHPGVDLTAFTPAALPDGPPHAVVVGALVPWKRPELALAVAALLPELRVTLAGGALPGEAAYEARLRARAGDRVTLLGPVADLRPLLASAHLLLHCADAEPYGMALIEALAAGRPVVAPAAGGPLEIVTPDSGRLYPPGDAQAAVAAIRDVLADPGNPRERAEAFDVEASARRLAAAIEDVAR